jgi:cobalt/nickel transport system ATP-binding protein
MRLSDWGPCAWNRRRPPGARWRTLAAVGIGALANRAPYRLSAGETNGSAIAGVVAMEPEILVLDEPTTFLDPPAQRSLAALLAHLR